jgi:hypothetical protein
MYKFNIKESFKTGWELTKKHWAVLVLANIFIIAVSLLLEVVNFTSMAFLSSFPGLDTGVYVFVQLLGFIISIWTGYNLSKLMINLVDGVPVKAVDVFHYSKDMNYRLLKYFGGILLFGLAVIAGLILFIIPGIYFAYRFGFVPYLLVDKDIEIMEAFKKSTEMTKGEIWHLIGFSVQSFFIMILGLLLLIIGFIPAAILVWFTYFVIYRKLEAYVPEKIA